MATVQLQKSNLKRRALALVVAALALYVVIPQLGGFQHSFDIVKQASLPDIAVAIGFSFLTYVAAAATYCLLAFRPLKFPRTILAQIASMFVNRLLPAGIGGIGANYVYLRKSSHTLPQAASVVTANNILGFAGHFLLTACLLIVLRDDLPQLRLAQVGRSVLLIGVVVVVLLGLVLLATTFKGRILAKIAATASQIIAYRRRPKRVLGAIITSIALTLCNVACLWFCVVSLNVPLSFIAVLLIFTLGVALGVATPTPGGLGGVEAGLVAGMVAYDVPIATALAVALTYRFINYWLALGVGAVAFSVCRKLGYL
jgi:uncharacterized membrane protein YbhN (UPF0104 family)